MVFRQSAMALGILIALSTDTAVLGISGDASSRLLRSFCARVSLGLSERILEWRQNQRLSKLEEAQDRLAKRLQTITRSGRPLSPELIQIWREALNLALELEVPLELEAINGATGKFERVTLTPSAAKEAAANIDNPLVAPYIVPSEKFRNGSMDSRRVPPQFTFTPGILTPEQKTKLEEVFELQERVRHLKIHLNHGIATQLAGPATMAMHQENGKFLQMSEILTDTATANRRDSSFPSNLQRIETLAEEHGPKYWDEAVEAIVLTARKEFKDIEPQETSIRVLLNQVSHLDNRLKPENVFEDHAYPIFAPEPKAAPQLQTETPTVDIETFDELQAIQDARADAGRSVDETRVMLAAMAEIPEPKSLMRGRKAVDKILEIFGTNLTRVNGFDLKRLRDEDGVEYRRVKDQLLNWISRSYPSYLKEKYRFAEMMDLLHHFSRVTNDNWDLPELFLR